MTDEMTIQQRPSAVPYVAGGALLGAGAGYGVNELFIKKPLNHEEIIKEVNDKDKLELRTKEGAKEADSWVKLSEKTKELAEAETKLEEAKNNLVLPDSDAEKIALDQAQKAYDEKFAELLKDEKAKNTPQTKLGKMQTVEKLNSSNILTPKEFDSVKPTLEKYENAVNTVKTKLKNSTELKTMRESVIDEYKTGEMLVRYRKLDPKSQNEFLSGKNMSKITDEAEKLADTRLKKLNSKTPNYDDFVKLQKEFGEDIIEISDKPVTKKGWRLHKVTSSGGTKYVNVDKDAVSKLKEKLTNNYIENLRKYINYDESIKEINNDFLKKHTVDITNVGLDPKKIADIDGLDLKQLNKTIKDLNSLDEVLKNDILTPAEVKTKVSSMIPGASCKGSTKDEVSAEIKNLIEQTEKKFDLKLQYNKAIADQKKVLREIFSSDSRIQQIVAENKAAINNDAAVKKYLADFEKLATSKNSLEKSAYEKIKAQLGVTKDMSDDEIKNIVKEKIKKYSESDALEVAQNKYNEAVKKSGKVDDAAVKAASDRVATLKGEVDNAAKELSSKMGKIGGNKYVAMAVGAVALALGALAIRPKQKNS